MMGETMRRSTEILRACTDVLDELGVSYTIERGRHLKVRWNYAGHSRTYVLSITPSDVRVRKNVRADMRRLLRQDRVHEGA
jgi:hypothetical protein